MVGFLIAGHICTFLLTAISSFRPSCLRGWPFAHACLAMADLSVRHFVQASLCSFKQVSSRRFVSPIPYRRCIVPRRQRWIVWLSVGGSLTLVRPPWRVGPDLNTVLILMLKSRHTFLVLSLTPATYVR